MQTLLEILKGEKSYDSSWAIYAEKIDGKFKAESSARFGQTIFENGGTLDNCELFCTNEAAVDSMSGYYGSFELLENLDSEREARIRQVWLEAHDNVEPPDLKTLCEWIEQIAQDPPADFFDFQYACEVIVDEAKEYWSDNLDTEAAALQLIDQINESV